MSGNIKHLPPMLTFQSLVDATVLTSAIVDRLYNRMTPNNSELVLFDVNRLSILDDFLQLKHNSLFEKIIESENKPYTLTLVTNISDTSSQVHAISVSNQATFGSRQTLNLACPTKYFLYHMLQFLSQKTTNFMAPLGLSH